MAQQVQFGGMLVIVAKSLCKIWRVPENMETALFREFVVKKGTEGVLKNVIYDVGAAVGVAGAVLAVVFTGGLLAPGLLGLYVGSVFAQVKGASSTFMTFSLLVLGLILYVKASQPTRSCTSWDHSWPLSTTTPSCAEASPPPIQDSNSNRSSRRTAAHGRRR